MDSSRVDSELILSDLDNSMDTFPDTPLTKCMDIDGEQGDAPSGVGKFSSARQGPRIKAETMISRMGSFAGITDTVSLEELFEYDWADSDSDSPSDKAKDSYMVQEMLADYLKIKSFKRKYPDLSRRVMDAYERSWLQQEGLVPVGRADLGLTALRTDEVMKLLQVDYPDVHVALNDLFRRRRFQKAAEQQKRQYEAARIERGEARAEAARRRALDSAADFNHRLIKERLTERRCYWDLQTMQIHFPQRRYKLLDPLPFPAGAYPVAVIPGQFVDRYEIYTPDRLLRLPLSRCLYSVPSRKHRDPPPLPTNLQFGSVQPRPTAVTFAVGESQGASNEPVDDLDEESGHPLSPSADRLTGSSTPIRSVESGLNREGRSATPVKQTGSADPAVCCMVCKSSADQFIRCAECGHTGHPRCLDISDAMLPSVQSYAWSCMECKRCVRCSDSGHEEQLMFCDQCDRGYHAFCVGLETIPHGQWKCPLCTGKPVDPVKPRTGRSGKSTAGQTNASRKRPRKPRKRRNQDDSDASDELDVKPPRRPRKRKRLNVSDDADSTNESTAQLDSSDTLSTGRTKPPDSEPVVKRKRGRPRRTDVESPPPKRKYKPRTPKKVKTEADAPSSSVVHRSPGESNSELPDNTDKPNDANTNSPKPVDDSQNVSPTESTEVDT